MDTQLDTEGDVVMDDGSSAAQQVFEIPELLEAILLTMSMKEILIYQRVARNWQNTIKGSNKLQRALFMQPLKHEDEVVALLDGLSEADKSRIKAGEGACQDLRLRRGSRVRQYIRRNQLKPDEVYCKVVLANPILLSNARYGPLSNVWRPENPLRNCKMECFSYLTSFAEEGTDTKIAKVVNNPNTKASYSKMFLTQPPIRSVRANKAGSTQKSWDITEEQHGVRMGDVIDNFWVWSTNTQQDFLPWPAKNIVALGGLWITVQEELDGLCAGTVVVEVQDWWKASLQAMEGR